MFLVRFFHDSVVGHECYFKCCAMELVLERCIISLLDRVVEVLYHKYLHQLMNSQKQ